MNDVANVIFFFPSFFSFLFFFHGKSLGEITDPQLWQGTCTLTAGMKGRNRARSDFAVGIFHKPISLMWKAVLVEMWHPLACFSLGPSPSWPVNIAARCEIFTSCMCVGERECSFCPHKYFFSYVIVFCSLLLSCLPPVDRHWIYCDALVHKCVQMKFKYHKKMKVNYAFLSSTFPFPHPIYLTPWRAVK